MTKKVDIEQTEIEAPYELPEGWKWIPLLESFENKTSSNKKLPTKDYSNSGKFAVVDQGQEFIGGYSDKSDFVFDGELPIIVFGDHTKCIKYIDFPFIQGADGVKILKPISIVDSKFFYYALQNIHFPDLGYRRHFPIFKDYLFPLPSTLVEQQRIVNRIETMFAKLDQAQEKAQAVLDSFETRKAAILHKAFTGELTANWRKENGVADESWEEKTIGECFTHTTGKALKKDNQNGTLREYITTSNLYWDRFDFSEVRTMYFTDDELEKCTAKKGDLLLCNGGDVGRAAIWNFDYDICLQNHVSKLRNKGSVETRLFLYYFMLSKIKGNVNGKGIGISSLSAKDLLAMSINLPSLPEQQEIVLILDTVLEKETRAKEAAQTVLDQIALLKKSILARAFRGEL